MKVGVFGGCFNPIHIGHTSLINEIVPIFNLEKIIFLPNMNPYYKKKESISFDLITKMIDIAVNKDINYEISTLESNKDEDYTTYETLKTMEDNYFEDDLYLILGTDQFLQLDKWKNCEILKKTANFIIVIREPYTINLDELIFKNKNYFSLLGKKNRVCTLKGKEGNELLFYDLVDKFNISSSSLREMISEGNIQNARKYLSGGVLDLILEERLYF